MLLRDEIDRHTTRIGRSAFRPEWPLLVAAQHTNRGSNRPLALIIIIVLSSFPGSDRSPTKDGELVGVVLNSFSKTKRTT